MLQSCLVCARPMETKHFCPSCAGKLKQAAEDAKFWRNVERETPNIQVDGRPTTLNYASMYSSILHDMLQENEQTQ